MFKETGLFWTIPGVLSTNFQRLILSHTAGTDKFVLNSGLQTLFTYKKVNNTKLDRPAGGKYVHFSAKL